MQAGYPLIALAVQWWGGWKGGASSEPSQDLFCERTGEGRDDPNLPALPHGRETLSAGFRRMVKRGESVAYRVKGANLMGMVLEKKAVTG